jgi:hypothetical protein
MSEITELAEGFRSGEDVGEAYQANRDELAKVAAGDLGVVREFCVDGSPIVSQALDKLLELAGAEDDRHREIVLSAVLCGAAERLAGVVGRGAAAFKVEQAAAFLQRADRPEWRP